jgi:hypothetical protein
MASSAEAGRQLRPALRVGPSRLRVDVRSDQGSELVAGAVELPLR